MTKPIIPEAALGQHIAVLGKTGSGKTYAAKGIVEHLLDQHRQVCTLDPTGAWWGLRLGSDGKSKGYDVVLLGGAHADIPLAERSGAAVARLVTEQHASVVIDTSGFTVGEYTRWFIDFAGTLYTTIRDPLHLVIDEAHYFMPQGKSPDVDAGRMLHAGNRLMSGGRSKGIRGILITQRPAKLHKDSLTCADTLIAMRVIAPQDRQAIKDWIDGAGDPVKGKGVLDSLAALKRGEGWVWYPEGGHLERASFPKIGTYDSSATPKHGAKAGPKVREIKLDEVHAAMAEAVKEAEANDPKLLRAEIARLKREAGKPTPTGKQAVTVKVSGARREDIATINALRKGLEEAMKVIVKINAKEFFKAGGEELDQAEIEKAIKGAAQSVKKMVEHHLEKRNAELNSLRREAQRVIARLKGMLENDVQVSVDVRHNEPFTVSPAAPRPTNASSKAATGQTRANGTSSSQQRILNALAWMEGVGIAPGDKTQVALLADQSPTSGGYFNNLGALRSAGLIDYPAPAKVALTDAGRASAETGDVPSTSEELHEQLIRRLSGSQGAILRKLIEVYPRDLAKDDLAEAANQSPTSGGYFNNLGRLRTLGLINYPTPGKVVALPVLFLE